MAKKLLEMKEALTKRYDGPIQEKNGFSYIPWNAMVQHLDTALGVDGYSVHIKEYKQESVTAPDGQITYGYSAIVALEITPDDADSFTREGLGFNELQFTRTGQALIDTSIKGAASGAIVRAAALLGDFGGLFLYDKAAPSHPPTPTPEARMQEHGQRQQVTAGQKPLLSEKQQGALRNKGFTQAGINGILTSGATWQSVKLLMDDAFAGVEPGEIMKKYGIVTEGGKDDYPF